MRLNISAAIGGFLLLVSACSQQTTDARRVENNILHSAEAPSMTLNPADGFVYAGSVKLPIKNVADAERYHWIIEEDGRIAKLIIAQFEGFFDEVDRTYNILLPETDLSGGNYKFTPETVMLGGKEFVHNTWAFDNARSARENPDLEAAATLNLLKSKGYTLDGELIMSRFARAVGEDRRHELILFYIEPLADHGYTLANFPEDDAMSEDYEALSDGLRQRSLESLSVDFPD